MTDEKLCVFIIIACGSRSCLLILAQLVVANDGLSFSCHRQRMLH